MIALTLAPAVATDTVFPKLPRLQVPGDPVRLPNVNQRARKWLLTAAAVLPAVITGCDQPTGPGTKTISGTLRGVDGSYVDAMLGFDILDAQGRPLLDNGEISTLGTYGALVRLNYCVRSAGTKDVNAGCDGHPATGQWALRLPANAATVYLEAYPKAASRSGWVGNYRGYSGPNPGTTDESTFAMTYRRSIPVVGNVAGVTLTMPTVCGRPDGSTGTLWGYLYRGNTVWTAGGGSTNAWSTEVDNAPILGMNAGRVDPGAGTYHITNLHGGSRYTIIASVDGVSRQFLTGAQPVVNACSSTRFDLHF